MPPNSPSRPGFAAGASAAGRMEDPPAAALPQLFRAEVLAERQPQWLGPVLVDPRRAHRYVALFAVVAAAALIGLLAYGSFTRTARVSGWLVPEAGVMRVFALQPGVVTGLHVQEGSSVRRGDRLLTLSNELSSATVGATQAAVARTLAERRQSLSDEQAQNRRLFEQRRRSLDERIAALRAEEAQIGQEIVLQQSRVELARKSEARLRELRGHGYISEQQAQQGEESRLEQTARIAALQRDRLNRTRERLALEGERNDLPLQAQGAAAAYARDIAAIEQEQAETEARRELVVPAPQDGTVTAILTELGGHVGTAGPLLTIVPAGAHLEAHLYGPSRAVGFVRPGQRVLLRYQAYPYQKFGHHEGVVTAVARAALNPGELPPQLAGADALAGKEPVYRITVRPARQTIDAYGVPQPLQAGMQLDAEIALEQRRLYEWMLDPLYTVTGRRAK